MKKKMSIVLVLLMILFTFAPALTLAQDSTGETDDTVVEEADDTTNNEETENEETPDTEDETEVSYESLDELLTAINESEDLSGLEKVTLERKLKSYEESLSIETMTSVTNKIIDEEIDLGQGFVILNNLDQSLKNGLEEEKVLELVNSYQNEDNAGQFSFQTALELRKLSRVDSSEETTANFAEDIASIIEENGRIETSELKKLSASYRKEAREKERMKSKNNSEQELDSVSAETIGNSKNNALNNSNNGNGNSNKQKSKSKGKSSDKSPNSNANKNAQK